MEEDLDLTLGLRAGPYTRRAGFPNEYSLTRRCWNSLKLIGLAPLTVSTGRQGNNPRHVPIRDFSSLARSHRTPDLSSPRDCPYPSSLFLLPLTVKGRSDAARDGVSLHPRQQTGGRHANGLLAGCY